MLTILFFVLLSYVNTSKEHTVNITKKDIKKILSHTATTHFYALATGALLTWGITNNAQQNRFEDREHNALNQFRTEYIDPATGRRVTAATFNPATLNRAYFDPTSYPTINWTNYSNQKVGEVFGEIIAKEMALGIDSINHGLTTPGKKYGLDYNYCNKSATTAIQDAVKRSGMTKRGKINIFDRKEGRRDALYNGDALVRYFKSQYDTVAGTVIENPEPSMFANIGKGAIVRFPGHTKVFIGRGFVDQSGRVFVPDDRGQPVIASGYNDSFEYFTGGNCTVVDMSKIVQHKLQNERGRHTR